MWFRHVSLNYVLNYLQFVQISISNWWRGKLGYFDVSLIHLFSMDVTVKWNKLQFQHKTVLSCFVFHLLIQPACDQHIHYDVSLFLKLSNHQDLQVGVIRFDPWQWKGFSKGDIKAC